MINKNTNLIVVVAFLLFVIAHLSPKLGLDIYLIVRWILLLGVPIALIYEIFLNKKQKNN